MERRSTRAYPWMIAVLVVFIGYQVYRIVLNPTAGLIALTVFDAVIVALTWREYGQQRRQRTTTDGQGSILTGMSTSGPRRV